MDFSTICKTCFFIRSYLLLLIKLAMIQKGRQRAPTWGSKPTWVSSLTKSSQYQRSKGVKFGGMFVAGKNSQYYQKMNNKDMLLPLQVCFKCAESLSCTFLFTLNPRCTVVFEYCTRSVFEWLKVVCYSDGQTDVIFHFSNR